MNELPLHGGDLVSAQEDHPGPILDFSVNVNPLGMPPAVAQAARDAVAASDAYPDPQCRALRRAIAAMDGVSSSQVCCGSGAAELLLRLAWVLRPRRAMVTAPTFGEYERTLAVTGCKVYAHYLKPDRRFDLEAGFLRTLRPKLDLLVLCNPNNPTGRLIDPELLEGVADFCESNHIWLLVDESFRLLSDGADSRGLVPLLERHPHLMLLRSMTKTWAMPGLRLGYLLSACPELPERLDRWGQPWVVSVPAQQAGIAACRCLDWAEQGRALVRAERPRLQRALEGQGFAVTESAANYLLFRAAGDTTLRSRLLQQGILLRSCANFRGLGPDWYRIAVRTPEENDRLIQVLAAGSGRETPWHTI